MANSKLNLAPQLKILPPTEAVFELHVARTHLQAVIWKGSLKLSPADLDLMDGPMILYKLGWYLWPFLAMLLLHLLTF